MANRRHRPLPPPRETEIILDNLHLTSAILNSMKQKKSSAEYITKSFFERSITQLLQGIRREIEFSAETVIEKLERKMQEHNDANLTRLDKIVKELENMREDRIIGDNQSKQVRQQVDNHEKRIKRLEVTQAAA